MKFLVGNDLIDLLEPEIKKKSKNERFIKRILSKNEYGRLRTENEPDIYLWSLWSAKESAYKILKKIIPDLVFSHSLFVVDKKTENSGIVTYKKYKINVNWHYSDSWIHCVGTYSKGNVQPEVLKWSVEKVENVNTNFEFSTGEVASIYSKESRAVRELAKREFFENSLLDIEILRFPQGVRFGPPEVWKDGAPLNDWDLSMSHDGRFVSALISKK